MRCCGTICRCSTRKYASMKLLVYDIIVVSQINEEVIEKFVKVLEDSPMNIIFLRLLQVKYTRVE